MSIFCLQKGEIIMSDNHRHICFVPFPTSNPYLERHKLIVSVFPRDMSRVFGRPLETNVFQLSCSHWCHGCCIVHAGNEDFVMSTLCRNCNSGYEKESCIKSQRSHESLLTPAPQLRIFGVSIGYQAMPVFCLVLQQPFKHLIPFSL